MALLGRFLIAVQLILAGGIALPTSANAIIILSGDGDISTALPIGNSNSNDGNRVFFSNLVEPGSNVSVLQNTSSQCCESFDENISAFYGSLDGVSATTVVGEVSVNALNGIDLFISAIPDDAFSASELSVLSAFYRDGGDIFFLGENGNFRTENGYINDALEAIGIPLRLLSANLGSGGTTLEGEFIARDPLTTGVDSFFVGAGSIVEGGRPLIFTLPGLPGSPPVAPIIATIPEPGIALQLFLGLAVLSRRGLYRSVGQ